MKLLSDVDGDEVSLVNRAANRRKFLLLKGDSRVENDLAEILEVPWEREGALLDEIRKDGIEDENVEKAVIAAVRLLKGIEGEFSPELLEKVGTALYPVRNPPLNIDAGVPSPGGLYGSAGSDEDEPPEGEEAGDSSTGSASGSSLEGSGSAPKVAAEAEPDADDAGGKKGFLRRRTKAQKEEVPSEIEEIEKGVTVNDEERGTVETHAVPVQKEDGSWDYTDVPDAHAAFFRTMIEKADETAAELEKTREQLAKADDTLLSRSMVEKAARYNHVAATDDLAPILKEASQKLDAETFEKLEKMFEAAEERVSKGALFEELGRTGLGNAESKQDAHSQMVTKANEMVEKGADLSFEAAYSKVMEQHPELYNQYLSEHGMGA